LPDWYPLAVLLSLEQEFYFMNTRMENEKLNDNDSSSDIIVQCQTLLLILSACCLCAFIMDFILLTSISDYQLSYFICHLHLLLLILKANTHFAISQEKKAESMPVQNPLKILVFSFLKNQTDVEF